MITYRSEITSMTNPKVKLWASLAEKKHRDKHRLFVIEGPHLVMEALKSNVPLDCIVVDMERPVAAEVLEIAQQSPKLNWVGVSEEIMKKCTHTVQPQGVFAVLPQFEQSIDSLMELAGSLILVADGVQDPGNLGTMIRSADAVGASAVLLGHGCVDLYNPKTVRSTMGSLFHLPIMEGDLSAILPRAAEQGVQLISAALDAEMSCYHVDYEASTWFIMGNEARGVSPEAEQYVTHRVRIPMRGGAESLNVAMASTVLLYEAFRQRGAK